MKLNFDVSVVCELSELENVTPVFTSDKHYITFDVKKHGKRFSCYSSQDDVIDFLVEPNHDSFTLVGSISTTKFNDRYYDTFFVNAINIK